MTPFILSVPLPILERTLVAHLDLIFPLTKTTNGKLFLLRPEQPETKSRERTATQSTATQGVIEPSTPMETDTGHKGTAGQIPGLFNATPPQPSVPPPHQVIQKEGHGSIWLTLLGVVVISLVGVAAWKIIVNFPSTPNLTAEGQTKINLSSAERAEADKYIAEYGSAVIRNYLKEETEKIKKIEEENGEQYNLTDNEQKRILKYLRYFVFKGADVNTQDGKDKTRPPLHFVAKCGDVGIAEFLVANGANANAKANDGESPLHVAAMARKRVEIAKFLVSKGADVNAKLTGDKLTGATPLHWAASQGDVEMVKFLVFKGANVKAKMDSFGTPIDMAKELAQVRINVSEYEEVIKYLSGLQ
jgi:hypothetical protein